MKRHPALRDLSRDHHDILLHARRLRGEDPKHGGEESLESYQRYRDAVLVHHLDEEERFVLSRVAPALAARFKRLRQELEQAPPARLGESLGLHARFCEGQLFPAMEAGMDAAAWASFTRESQAFRRAVRPLSIGKDNGEACFL